MNIVDPVPDDLTLDQAARIAGCGAKTLRRAVRDGHLPRRYAPCPRGLKLVFGRADLEHWLASRRATGGAACRTARGPGTASARPDLPAQVAEVETLLGESREMIAGLTARLRDQEDGMAATRAAIAELTRRLAGLEASSAAVQRLAPGPECTRAPRP